MMQVDYDMNFDRTTPNSERIFRIEALNIVESTQAVICRPMAELLFRSSPHIEAGTLMEGFFGTSYFSVGNEWYNLPTRGVDSAFVALFKPEIIEGTARALDEPDKVIIPQSIAQRLFGNDEAVGKELKISGTKARTIGAVYRDFPENSSLPNAVLHSIGSENRDVWSNFNYHAYVLLDSPEAADEVLTQMRAALPAEVGNGESTLKFGAEQTFRLDALPELHFISDVSWDTTPKASRSKIALLFAIAVAILLIAAINFVNFSMALVPGRIKSINIQKILGATRARLRLSLIAEATLMCLVSFLSALLFVALLSDVPTVASLVDARMSLRHFPVLIALTAATAIVLGIVAGAYPAFYSTSVQPAFVLKGSFGLTMHGKALRNGLIGIQFVASLALIIVASFMYLQNRYLFTMPLGYDRDGVIVSDLNEDIKQQKDVLVNELKALKGVEDVSFSESLLGSSDQYMGWGRNYRDETINFQILPVAPNFLRLMNIHVNEGRDFNDDDDKTRQGVFIFNEKARQQYNMELNTDIGGAEIVGFIPDVQFRTFHSETTPMAFYVWGEERWGIGDRSNAVYVKMSAGSSMYEALKQVKEVFSRLAPDYPFNIRFYDDVLQKAYSADTRITTQITIFSVVSIIISLVGVFGLVLLETRFRRREIAIRKVFGASNGDVVRLFTSRYVLIWAICFVLACPLAWLFTTRWLQNFAYRTPLHAWVFVAAGATVLAITALTAALQSRRAAMKLRLGV
jgi:putative ABC transport system permease protein